MIRPVLLFTLLAFGVQAADDAASIRTTFVEPWLAALRSDDPGGLTRFLHPSVQACLNERTREFFESGTLLRPNDAKAPYKVTRLVEWTEPGPLFGLPEEGFEYPVSPTYEVHLESATGETEVVRYLAESDGTWYLSAPCPNEKGVAMVRQKQAEARAQAERAFRLANQLKEPLRSELLYLVSKQRTAEAARKYQQATGLDDVTVAMMVVRVIAP